jgi:TMEM175 potassium channel family protein
MEKSRIAALVDGTFAVAMTLLVLDLKLPEGVKTGNDVEVWRQLLELQGRFTTYALSFIVLGTYWIGHHSLFHFVRRVSRGLLWLNLIFLLFATLLPFSTNLLADRRQLHIPVAFYGTNLLLLSLISMLQLRYLADHPELSHDQLTPSWIRNVRRRTAIPAVIAAASIAISFYNPNLALSAYWLLLVFHFLPGRHLHPPEVKD